MYALYKHNCFWHELYTGRLTLKAIQVIQVKELPPPPFLCELISKCVVVVVFYPSLT